ncbi:MAG: hypothetical protein E6355_02035, partial [Streptococcus mitis]|nr:hypothetical protein [Streptococcus mitis]
MYEKRRSFTKSLVFSQEVGKEDALAPDFQRENWQAIQVPHDWSIYNDFDQYSPAQNEGGQLNG